MSEKLGKYFNRSEFNCRCGCGFNTIDVKTYRIINRLRTWAKSPVHINSGCRCVAYNEEVKKRDNPNYVPFSSKSQHMRSRAVDIRVDGKTPQEIYEYLDKRTKSNEWFARNSFFIKR